MITVVEIEWSGDTEHWLCPENIQLALEACCANPDFKVKRVEVVSMLTRFSSVDELLKELESSKFPVVGIPYAWNFGGLIKIDLNRPNVLLIKDKEYPIVASIADKAIVIIAVPGV